MPTNLLGLDPRAIEAFCLDLGESKFRATQLLRWVHKNGVRDFSAMNNLAKSLRQKLQDNAIITDLSVISKTVATDGTCKWLLDVGASNAIETVFIPEINRGTLCISSQVGCAVNCYFCATGKQGFSRNLSTAEIVGQLWLAEHVEPNLISRVSQNENAINKDPVLIQNCSRVTNIVMMGMGEPLLNFDNVVSAMRIMLNANAYALSKRKVTLSTSGIVPMMDRLAQELPVSLAVSLHAPNDDLRNHLVPINKKYPITELMHACERYLLNSPKNFISFEYCMLRDINDRPEQALELIDLLKRVPSKVNLIPFNAIENSELRCSSKQKIVDFAKILQNAGIITTIRKTRGELISAACGQLAGKVQDRTHIMRRSYTQQESRESSIA